MFYYLFDIFVNDNYNLYILGCKRQHEGHCTELKKDRHFNFLSPLPTTVKHNQVLFALLVWCRMPATAWVPSAGYCGCH